MSSNGHTLTLDQLAAKNGYPDPAQNDHTCPACGHPVECNWKKLTESRRVARDMILQANRAEAKLLGMPFGKRANREFTKEEAVELVAKLGNISRAAKALGVNWQTVKDRIDKGTTHGGRWHPKLPEGVTMTRRET